MAYYSMPRFVSWNRQHAAVPQLPCERRDADGSLPWPIASTCQSSVSATSIATGGLPLAAKPVRYRRARDRPRQSPSIVLVNHAGSTMTPDQLMDPQELKKSIREQAHANRKAQENKDELSQAICEKFAALPEFAAAGCVMFYIDVRTEVRTRHYLPALLASGKRIVVPYCVDDDAGAVSAGKHGRAGDRHVQDSGAQARAARAARQAGRRQGARPDHGAGRGLRPPRRADGARLRLLRQAARARPARRAAGGAGLRVPALPRDSDAGARHLHGQDHHRAGDLSRGKGGNAWQLRVAPRSRTPTPRRFAASTPRF